MLPKPVGCGGSDMPEMDFIAMPRVTVILSANGCSEAYGVPEKSMLFGYELAPEPHGVYQTTKRFGTLTASALETDASRNGRAKETPPTPFRKRRRGKGFRLRK